MDGENMSAPAVSIEDQLDAALRAKLTEAYTQAMADPRKMRSLTIGRSFVGGEVSFGALGVTSETFEILDAQTIESAAKCIETVVMSGKQHTEDGAALIAEATMRIMVADENDRVSHEWVAERLLRITQRTEGKVKLISFDESGQPYMGCGDPDCHNCGGDGSALQEDKETESIEPKPARMLH